MISFEAKHHENAQQLSKEEANGVCVMSRACPKPAVVSYSLMMLIRDVWNEKGGLI